MMASTLGSSSSTLSDVSQFYHTPSYCEENVYLLCKKLCADGVADVSDLFVVFISNEHKHVPLWHQKASHRADGIILWDYHVVCIQRGKEGKSDVVWDLDSSLPFPSTLPSYVSESIRPSFELFSEFQRVFRIVHAPIFLRNFASDRRHMKDSEGNWMATPPVHEVIVAEDGSVHNLNQYMDMSTKEVLKDLEKDSINEDEKIDKLSAQVSELSTVVLSLKEVLTHLGKHKLHMPPPASGPSNSNADKAIPKPTSHVHQPAEKPLFTPPLLINNHFDNSLFSLPKVKLPQFEGTDPRGWLTKAELYFMVNQIPATQKLHLAQMCLDGVALNWYTNLLIKHPTTNWNQFRDKLMTRFSGTKFRNAHVALGSLFQEGSVEEYLEDFEALSALIPDQSEEQSIGMFLRGLKPEIRNWVRALNPNSCDQAMDFARHVAVATSSPLEKTTAYRSSSFTGTKYQSGSNWKASYPKLDTVQPTPFIKPTPQTNPTVARTQATPNPNRTRHLSKSEWEERRRLGLCFGCGQKYTPQHKCSAGQLRIMLLTDGDEISDEGEVRLLELDGSEDLPDDGECSSLELCGVTSDSSSSSDLKTLKISGQIRGFPALILLDTGATHNFISKKLARALGIEFFSIGPLGIRLGDGNRVWVTSQCRQVPFSFGSFNCTVDALVYDLGPLDFILGIAWLKRLGDVVFNWQTNVVRFWQEGEEVQLKGINSPLLNHSSLRNCLDKHLNSLTVDPGETSILTPIQSQQLTALLDTFPLLFHQPQGLPPARTIEHKITLLDGHGPICVRPYRYPHAHKDEIQRQVAEMLQSGIIRVSQSAFSSPVILVKKKDATWRLCIDYRALNKATIPDKYPIPVVEELLDELHGSRYFSKIDLKSGFYQVRVRDSDVDKTAIRTHDGHYEFLVMHFGLTNAPATSTWDHHLELLHSVLQLLQQHELVVNKKKSHFGIESVEYLGHIIDSRGVSMDPAKIKSVTEWPVPSNVKGVRGFLGLMGYYRKFIRGYGKIAQPLTELTKKDNYGWNLQAQEAFNTLKRCLTTAPVLALPDFAKPFEIECDASGKGLGAVLMQERRPIAYYSKALSARTLAKSAYEKEIMALALSIQHWRPYLLGRHFTVFTDQKSLKHLLDQHITTCDQQNWLSKLMGYDFSIAYKPGPDNRAADALSRIHEGSELFTMVSSPQWLEGNNLLEGYADDTQIQKVIKNLSDHPLAYPKFALHNGRLYYKHKLVIPATSPWMPHLLKEFHCTPSGGHSGFLRTYKKLSANIYWFGMTKTVKSFVQQCDICQRYKASTLAPVGLLQPLPIPSAIWEDISLDFITGLPKSKGFEAILVVVDRLSKYCHFAPLKHLYTARSLAETFLKEIIRLHGIPKTIISDQDPIFLSKFWQEIFKMQGSSLRFSSAYHPETDGQTEVVNRSLETYLCCFAADQPKTWSYWLPWAEFWHNTSYHSSTNTAPFEIVYGRPPPTLFRYAPDEIKCEAVQQDLQDRDEAIKQLKYHLSRAQSQMKTSADKHRRDVDFEVGDWVFLKLRPHRQQSVIHRINQKLAARFYGPFLITARVGPVAYKLQLPDSAKVYPVFHVSLLKRAVGNAPVEPELPQGLVGESEVEKTPDKCLATRLTTKDGTEIEQWLIQWTPGSSEDSTWEDATLVQTKFPNFKLEDKLDLQAAGIDRECDDNTVTNQLEQFSGPKPWIVYTRRARPRGRE
ncbi:hypothetical protein LXL04_036259 [Taraxacum kok-saghyz]